MMLSTARTPTARPLRARTPRAPASPTGRETACLLIHRVPPFRLELTTHQLRPHELQHLVNRRRRAPRQGAMMSANPIVNPLRITPTVLPGCSRAQVRKASHSAQMSAWAASRSVVVIASFLRGGQALQDFHQALQRRHKELSDTLTDPLQALHVIQHLIDERGAQFELRPVRVFR